MSFKKLRVYASFVIALVILCICTVPLTARSRYIITTVAGNGSTLFSGDGGPAAQAGLGCVYCIWLGNDGSILLSDACANRVRRIGTDGVIRTIAGNGEELTEEKYTAGEGGDNGPAINAAMNCPCGVCEDGEGNIYFTDPFVHLVRRIDKAGIITTVAGVGWKGYGGDGGLGKKARLNSPFGLWCDMLGNILLADNDNCCVRKIDATGIITTVAGGGKIVRSEGKAASTAVLFKYVSDVTATPSGIIYFTTGCAIMSVDTNGMLHTILGNPSIANYHGATESVGDSPLDTPQGVCVDGEGNLFIADTNNHCIKKIGSDGRIETIAGNGEPGFSKDGGWAIDAMLNFPWDICVDKDGNVYFADLENHRIRKLERVIE